jgi:hypothetical protein
MCKEPLTVGGGVSIAKTFERSAERLKEYVPCDSQEVTHLGSMSSREGFSGAVDIGLKS